ncbi:MAG: nicotinate (nicotinamide) nucleotide adenylyltransferase [Phycisphaerales bacterium]|nr:nicotinate (nicotinamide) nucleotide adenylyltransferase [Phycisphaerales bacterium]
MTANTKKVLLFGGTFDPIHNGHLATAAAACNELAADEVCFMPAATSPFKIGQACAPASHRLAMVQLAIADNPRFTASDLEITFPPPSYTFNTLQRLHATHSNTNILLLIGADQLSKLHAWHNINELLHLADLAILPRPGSPTAPATPAQINPAAWAARPRLWLATPLTPISSTHVRRRVALGLPISGLVPPAVERYIKYYALYQQSA